MYYSGTTATLRLSRCAKAMCKGDVSENVAANNQKAGVAVSAAPAFYADRDRRSQRLACSFAS
jgi:hypothetical protein